MKIQGNADFDASAEAVWEALLDPGVISRCIPGCQALNEIDEDTYAATLKIGIGAVSGTYQGVLRIREKDPPSHYAMAFEGGGRQGFVRGSGEARLHSVNGTTRVSYDCDVEVGGLIASVGHRVLEGVSQFLIGQMFTRLRGHVGQGEAHEARSV